MQKRKLLLKPCPKPPSAPPTIAQRRKLSNLPTTAPSVTGSSTDDGSQHSIATTSLLLDDAGFVHDSGVSQLAGSEAVMGVEPLVQGVLDKVMGDVTENVERAHSHSYEPRPALNQARKEEMRSKSFGPTINSLQRAYSKLLHENFDNQWSSEIAGRVRDLAAAIVWKLDVNATEATEEGRELMVEMLEHLQVEFKWEKILKILESAANIARTEKANAYKHAKTCQDKLREKRNSS